MYTITIMRQFGSMGRPIAKELSGLLHIDFYDRDIVEKASGWMQMSVKEISSKEERSKYQYRYLRFPLGTDESYVQDAIFDTQKRVILDVSEKSSCIIVGRCADFILRNRANVLNFYIYAPPEVRLRNCIENLYMTETVARRMLVDADKARRAYHRRYAGYEPQDPAHKQFMIDSSVLGTEGTAQLIADIVRLKFPEG